MANSGGKNRALQLAAEITLDNSQAMTKLEETKQRTMTFGEKVGQTFKNVSSSVVSIGTAAVAVGAAVKTVMALAEGAAENQTALAKVSTLLDTTKVNTDAYYESIKEGAKEANVAVKDYAEAVYSAISASVAQEEAVSFVTDAVKLAKGGFTEAATAVDLLTTVLNAYNLSSEQTAHISDVLITTQNLGKTTVNELGSSMGKVIPLANALGVSIEQLSAMYAQSTKNGVATAETGTQIKAMLSELSKSTSTVNKVLKVLYGESFKELMDEGKSVGEVLGALNQYAMDNGVSLNNIFSSVEAGQAALILAKENGTELYDIWQQINESSGAADEAYGKMMDTYSEKLTKFKLEWDEWKNEWGEALMPIAETLMAVFSAPKNPFKEAKENSVGMFTGDGNGKWTVHFADMGDGTTSNSTTSTQNININIETVNNNGGQSIEELTDQIAEELQRKLSGRSLLDNR